MIANRLRTPRGLVLAAILGLAALFTAWIAIRATAAQLVSGGNSNASAIVGEQPEYVLGAAMGAFVARRGVVQARSLPAVRRAAAEMPLDARPYLLVGSSYLRAGRAAQAQAALEAGRRLNPRQRWIHLLLLDRYLRTGSYALAADQLAVLSRLVGAAQTPIAAALAQMSVAPETRDAVRLTLRQDPALERAVLGSLAGATVDPSTIFAMASPIAWTAANAPGGWGIALVDRLVRQGRYRYARMVWQRINRIGDRSATSLLYDTGLERLPGSPPFNWNFASNNIAAVDVRGNRLEIDYYGRDTGELASQLLVLAPGGYRFAYTVGGTQRESGPKLQWSVACEASPPRSLAEQDVVLPRNGARRFAFGFTVPANCTAQRLRLVGMAGEFPVPISATIERLQLDRTPAR